MSEQKQAMKKCPDCGPQPLSAFGNDKTRKDKKSLYCLMCFRLRRRESWAKGKEK